jgi:hypothetical protein
VSAAVKRATWVVEGLTSRRATSDNPPEESTLTPKLLIDVASRYNEALLANIDALDIALLTILGVDVGFAAFAVDKLRRLDCRTEWDAIACIICCAGLCLLGYVCGVWGTRNGIAPEPLIADYRERGGTAISTAIDVLARRGRQNAWISCTKRIIAATAVIVFLTGGWTVIKPVVVEGDSPSRAACKVVK